MNLYKMYMTTTMKKGGPKLVNRIEKVDNNYYIDNKHLFINDEHNHNSDLMILSGWAFNSKENFYLFDIDKYLMEPRNNSSTHDYFVEYIKVTLRDDRITDLLNG